MKPKNSQRRLKTFFLIVFSLLGIAMYGLIFPSQASAAAYTWDGGGSTNNWSDCDNWSTNVCPIAADTVTFNNTSTKNSNVDASWGGTVTSVTIASGYTGTITMQRSLTTSSTFVQSDGTFNAANQTLQINSNFTMNAGSTFTASSGTTNYFANFTINGGTFNHNSGTVLFSGNGGTLNCNNVVFNSVQFVAVGVSGKTVNSTCSLPIGNSPSLPVALTLNGTLTGTGTLSLTHAGGLTTILNSGAALSGFNGLSVTTSDTNFRVAGANFNASSYSTFNVTANNSTLSITSGTISLPSTVNLNILSITGGTFNAPSGVLSVNGNITISGSPTFNANGGTLTLTGNGANVIACNNVTFNLVTFNQGGNGVKTINSDCTLPLGANPTLSRGLTLNGTLSGSGTLTFGNFTTTFNSGATLTGFSGVSFPGTTTIAGATMNFSGYTSFVANAAFSMSSGSLSLPSGADFNSSLAISGGTFTAPSGDMTLAGNLTISASPIFNATGGTFIFDGSTAILSCNNATFNLVRFEHTASTKTINSNCSLPLGNNPFIPRQITLNGTLTGSGTITLLIGPNRFNAGSVLSGFSGINSAAATFNLEGATLDLTGYTTFITGATNINSGTITLPNGADVGTLVLASGTVNAPSGTMSIAGNWTKTGATFNHNNGTVVWQNRSGLTDTRTISGDNTFFNLRILSNGLENTKTFTAGTTQTVLGALVIDGPLTLNSTISGTQWSIDAQGSRTLSGLTVQDSNNINSQVMFATNSVDGGNNVNWFFSDGSAPSFNIIGPQDTSYINNPRPGFTWQAATTTAGTNIDHYVLQMDNGAIDGNWEILDIPAYWGGTYVTSKYIASYQGFDDDNPNNNYITVTTQSSTDWGPMENDGMVAEGANSWQITVFDTGGNATMLSKNILLDLTQPATTITRIPSASLTNATTNTYSTRNRQPVLFGSIQDPLNGNLSTDMIASGPNQVQVTITKRNVLGLYLFPTTQIVPITQTFWVADSGQINDNFQNTSSKYSPFSFTPITPFTPGTYQITVNGNDVANNTSQNSTVYLQVR